MAETTMRLQDAIALATRAHAGVLDRGGVAYIEHPLRVMARVSSDRAKIVAVLHDTVEDTQVTLLELRRRGAPEEVVAAVDALTIRPGESRDDYYARVARNPLALTVKHADIADNMDERRLALLPHESASRLRRKYTHALEVLPPDPGASPSLG